MISQESTAPDLDSGTGKPKLWSTPYVLTLAAICIASITMTLFMPLLPIYIKQIGMDLAIGLGAMVWGVVSQAFGYPVIYYGGIACMALAALACLRVLRKQA